MIRSAQIAIALIVVFTLLSFQNCAKPLPAEPSSQSGSSANASSTDATPRPSASVVPLPTDNGSNSPVTARVEDGSCTSDDSKEPMAVKGVPSRGAIVPFVRSDGSVALWNINTPTLVNAGIVCKISEAGWQLAGYGDFDGDLQTDLVWLNSQDGRVLVWLMNGLTRTRTAIVGQVTGAWKIVGTGDTDGDMRSDLFFRSGTNGAIVVWKMNGLVATPYTTQNALATNWKVQGVGDFNGDKKADVLIRDDTGALASWYMNGGAILSSQNLELTDVKGVKTPIVLATNYVIRGVADVDYSFGFHKADLIMFDPAKSEVTTWIMDGNTLAISALSFKSAPGWDLKLMLDVTGDARADYLWIAASGALAVSPATSTGMPTLTNEYPPSIQSGWSLFVYPQ